MASRKDKIRIKTEIWTASGETDKGKAFSVLFDRFPTEKQVDVVIKKSGFGDPKIWALSKQPVWSV
jgi:hypothetical protein